MGIIGACRSVGVTHLAVWTANYLTGARRERTAVLEWNCHGDFERMGKFCMGQYSREGKKQGLYRILEVDYYARAGMEELAACLNEGYQYIIVDYGEITGQNLLDCARCDLKVIVGSLSEWQAKMFSGAVTGKEKRDTSWRYAIAFGSEEARKRMERCFRIPVKRIPDSRDVFVVTRADMNFFTELLGD